MCVAAVKIKIDEGGEGSLHKPRCNDSGWVSPQSSFNWNSSGFLEEKRILGMWNGVLDFSENGTCHIHIYKVLLRARKPPFFVIQYCVRIMEIIYCGYFNRLSNPAFFYSTLDNSRRYWIRVRMESLLDAEHICIDMYVCVYLCAKRD